MPANRGHHDRDQATLVHVASERQQAMTARVPRQPPGPATNPAPDSGAEHDLRALFGQSSAVFASLAGPAHVVEAANAAFFASIGGAERARTGVPIGQLMPELAEQGFLALLNRVYRTGEGHTARDARVLLGSGAAVREAFFDFSYEPRLDAGDNVVGVRVIGVETTQVKQAQRPARVIAALTDAVRDFTGGTDTDDDQAALVLTATRRRGSQPA